MRRATDSLISSLDPVDKLLNYSKSELLFIRVRSEALRLKMKLTEMELLLDTYNSQSMEALKSLSSKLNSQADQRKKEIDDISARIYAYENVGGEFDSLVKEYASLTEDLQEKKDMLIQMNISDTV